MTVAANAATPLAAVHGDLSGLVGPIFILDLKPRAPGSASNLAPRFALEPLETDRPVNAGGYTNFDDNHYCLFPGDTATATVEWQVVPREERRLSVAGWNTPAIQVGE